MDNNQTEGEGDKEPKRVPEPAPFPTNEVSGMQPQEQPQDRTNSPQNFPFNVPNSQQESMGMHQQRMSQHPQGRHPSQFHNPFLPQRVHQYMRAQMPHSYVHQRQQQYMHQSQSSQGFPLGPPNEHGGRMPIPNMQGHLPPPPPPGHLGGIQPLPSGHSLSSLMNNERTRNISMYHHQHPAQPSQVIERTLDKCITAADFFSQFRREKLDQQGAIHIRGPNCTVNRRTYSSIFMFTRGSKEELLKEQLKETEEKTRKRKKGRKSGHVQQAEQQSQHPSLGVPGLGPNSMMPPVDYSRGNDLPKRDFHVLRERTDGNGKILIVTIPKGNFSDFDFENFRITKFCRIYDRTRNVRKQKLFKKEVPKDSFLYYCWPCKDHFLFNKGRFIKLNQHVCRLLPLTLSLKQSKIKKEKGSGKKDELCFQLRMDNLNGNLRAANDPTEVSNATSKEFIVLLEDSSRRVIGFTFFFEYNSGNFHPKRRNASQAQAQAVAAQIPPPPPPISQVPSVHGTEPENQEVGAPNIDEGSDNSTSRLPSLISTFPHGGNPGQTIPFQMLNQQPPVRLPGNHGYREDTQKEYFLCRTFNFGAIDTPMFGKVFGHSFKYGIQHNGENKEVNFPSIFDPVVDHTAYEKERRNRVHSNLKRKGSSGGKRKKKTPKKTLPPPSIPGLSMMPAPIPPPRPVDILGGELPPLPPAPPRPNIGDVVGGVKPVTDIGEGGGTDKDYTHPAFRIIGMSQRGLVLSRDFGRGLQEEEELEMGGEKVTDETSIGKKRDREDGDDDPVGEGEPDIKRRKID